MKIDPLFLFHVWIAAESPEEWGELEYVAGSVKNGPIHFLLFLLYLSLSIYKSQLLEATLLYKTRGSWVHFSIPSAPNLHKKWANINITQEIFKNQLSNATNEYLQQESQLSNVFQFTFSFTPHGLKLQVYFICLVHAGMGPEPRIHAWSGKHPNNWAISHPSIFLGVCFLRFIYIYIYFMFMGVLSTCACTLCSIHRGQKMVLEPLKLEL